MTQRYQVARVVYAFFASKLAPTGVRFRSLAIGQQPARNALDVACLGNRRVYRMIRPLAAAFEHLDIAVQVTGAGQQDVLQVVFRQVHRARGADQDAVLAEQAHGLLVEAAVGAFAVFHVFFAFDEGRWVGDDHVEAFFAGFQFFQGFEDVAFDAGHFLGDAIQRGVALDAVEGEGRGVDAEYFSGAEGRRLHAPAADVAVQVEYALAFGIRGQACAVHAVVVEPAGFLALDHRGFEFHAVLFQRDPLRHQAEHGFDVAVEAFGVTRGGVILEQNAAWLEHLGQGGDHVFFMRFHGRRGDLYHQDVAETVDHQARQQVGIAVDQAVERLVEQAITQGQGDVQAVYQQRFVQRQLDVARQQACADQVVRAHGHDAQGLAAGRFQDGLVACLEAVKWGGGHVDFVAVDPQVAVAQTTIGIGFETQAWQGHDVAPEKRAGVYRVT